MKLLLYCHLHQLPASVTRTAVLPPNTISSETHVPRQSERESLEMLSSVLSPLLTAAGQPGSGDENHWTLPRTRFFSHPPRVHPRHSVCPLFLQAPLGCYLSGACVSVDHGSVADVSCPSRILEGVDGLFHVDIRWGDACHHASPAVSAQRVLKKIAATKATQAGVIGERKAAGPAAGGEEESPGGETLERQGDTLPPPGKVGRSRWPEVPGRK